MQIGVSDAPCLRNQHVTPPTFPTSATKASSEGEARLPTQESCAAASRSPPEEPGSQKQLNLGEVMDDSESRRGGGPQKVKRN